MAMLPVKALPLLGLLTWAHRATDVATLETESSAPGACKTAKFHPGGVGSRLGPLGKEYKTCYKLEPGNGDCTSWVTLWRDEFVLCQPYTIELGRRGYRTQTKICGVETENASPALKRVTCSWRGNPNLQARMEAAKTQAQEKCQKILCDMAKNGTWQTFHKDEAKEKPWPKYVSTVGIWGWQRAAEEKCDQLLSYAGETLIDPAKLWGNLVKGDTFNKEACE